MFRRPPRSTLDRSSAASDVYKRQVTIEGSEIEASIVMKNCTISNIKGRIDSSLLADNAQLSSTNHMPATHRFAVSYTHLRAHETVLDLVCRLLLEKKKKNKKKKIKNTKKKKRKQTK